MILHRDIGDSEPDRKQKLRSLIRSGNIVLAGNVTLKIFGKLHCRSGKKMKMTNRIFFKSKQEAIGSGYRPCGHCMPEEYKTWKKK